MHEGRHHIGTSGWSYGWNDFYPADLPGREYLSYYSRRFHTVEVNSSFYHLPRPSTYRKWAAQTPGDFVFAVKLSRFITHIRRLSGVDAELQSFLSNASALGPKLGPILVQLPPSLQFDAGLLNKFLIAVRDAGSASGTGVSVRLALEFRHRSWFARPAIHEAAEVLTGHNAAFVLAHSSRFPYPEEEPVTSDFVYLRFHGPGRMFASLYGKELLMRWRPGLRRWAERGLDVFAYFNNDVQGYAVADARQLTEIAEETAR